MLVGQFLMQTKQRDTAARARVRKSNKLNLLQLSSLLVFIYLPILVHSILFFVIFHYCVSFFEIKLYGTCTGNIISGKNWTFSLFLDAILPS